MELRLTNGPSPVPSKETIWGLPGAVSLTARLAIREPPAVGAKLTLTVQFPEGAKAVPQLLVWLKSEAFMPLMLMLLMLNDDVPVFASRMAEALPLVPTVCGTKFTRPGCGERNGPVTPVPLRGTERRLIFVLSVIVMEPDSCPFSVGAKFTVTTQDVPIARVAPQSLVWLKSPLAATLAMLKDTLLGLLMVIVREALVVPTP